MEHNLDRFQRRIEAGRVCGRAVEPRALLGEY